MINTENFLRHVHDKHSQKAFAFILKKEKTEEWEDQESSMRSSEPLKIDDFINQALAHAYIETEDVYYSLNNFYYPKYGNARQDGNIFGINALGIDFDYYKIPQYKNLSADEFYNNILKKKLPFKPTYVVDSGRGIYLLYKIEKCPKAMLQYYKTVYKHFVKEFEAYGADPIATLATQVLRLPGTMNSKSNSLVEIIEANQTDYSITDFQTLLPYKYEKVKELKEELTTEKLEQPYKKPIKNAQLPAELLNGTVIVDKRFRRARNTRFMKLFIQDLKTLIKHRNKLGHNEGARANLLYHARYMALYNGHDPEDVINLAIELNDMMVDPIPERVMLQQTKPSKIHASHPKIETMMRKLFITDEEAMMMNVLTTKDHKKRRKLKKMANKKRELYFMGKTKFQYELHLKRKVVYEMHRQGRANKDIAETLNLSPQNVSNYIKYAKNHLYEFMKKLEEVVEAILGYIHNDEIVRTLTPTHYKVALEAVKMSDSPPD